MFIISSPFTRYPKATALIAYLRRGKARFLQKFDKILKKQIISFSQDTAASPRLTIYEACTVCDASTVKQNNFTIKLEEIRGQPLPYLNIIAFKMNLPAQILFDFAYMASKTGALLENITIFLIVAGKIHQNEA